MMFFMTFLTVLFSSGSEIILLLGPSAGIGFYTMVYFYYRNTNKSYNYEEETGIEVFRMQHYDRRKGVNNGTEAVRIRGENTNNHRQRIQRF